MFSFKKLEEDNEDKKEEQEQPHSVAKDPKEIPEHAGESVDSVTPPKKVQINVPTGEPKEEPSAPQTSQPNSGEVTTPAAAPTPTGPSGEQKANAKIFVTRKIPSVGIESLKEKGHHVVVSEKDGVLTREELLSALKADQYDAVLCLLTDKIDSEVYDAAPNAKIFANYAVGYNNLDVPAAKERSVVVTNTPGVLTDTVAEYAFSLMLAVAKRIPEADRFTKELKYQGWAPELFLGSDMKGKTLGILGAGRIGSGVAARAFYGLGMRVKYYDVNRNEQLEEELHAEYRQTVDEIMKEADVVSVHVPLLDSTKHLVNKERLSMMKPTAYLINTSRGPVVDETALVEALRNGTIAGAGLDVFEDEPALAHGLPELSNAVITPHIASASVETRSKMSEMAAQNIADFLDGNTPPNVVKELQ